jgi:protein-disulfide isomerase
MILLGATAGSAEEAINPASRAAIEQIIRDYLLEHPEVILQAMQAMQERRLAAQQAQAARQVAAHQDDLLRDASAPVGGDPAGDVTVVEFFDYRCSYCRATADTVEKLVDSDARLRIVYKEFPVLGPESMLAAQAALAAHVQGKYRAFHRALMSAPEPFTLEGIVKLAANVGLDPDRLRADMAQPEIQKAIERNQALAKDLGITATPTFVVGARVVPGAMSLDMLKTLVAEARAK